MNGMLWKKILIDPSLLSNKLNIKCPTGLDVSKIFYNMVFLSLQLYTQYWISGEGNFERQSGTIGECSKSKHLNGG